MEVLIKIEMECGEVTIGAAITTFNQADPTLNVEP
jgi:hypothetical protein